MNGGRYLKSIIQIVQKVIWKSIYSDLMEFSRSREVEEKNDGGEGVSRSQLGG